MWHVCALPYERNHMLAVIRIRDQDRATGSPAIGRRCGCSEARILLLRKSETHPTRLGGLRHSILWSIHGDFNKQQPVHY